MGAGSSRLFCNFERRERELDSQIPFFLSGEKTFEKEDNQSTIKARRGRKGKDEG